jgi:cyclophilin family peptidyl-prolyl cis-trans isomerase
MIIKRIFLLFFLLLITTACQKNYKVVNFNEESKKGITLDSLISGEGQLVATIETNYGTIKFEMFLQEAPRTVKNFIGLSIQGYYDGLLFHRVVKDFMIQGGDSTGTGGGGRSYFGVEFEDEFSNQLRHNAPGIVSMANRGPNTNTSQFFITTIATPFLDGKHTIFGKVIEGMDIVYEIGKVETAGSEKPIKDVIMKKIYVEKRIF